jgi:hypothetical protein
MEKKYTFYSDPGHGWIEVDIPELIRLGIFLDISSYSYVNGKKAYLEEDMDAGTFLNAKKEIDGYNYRDHGFIEIHQEVTPIRNYPSILTAQEQYKQECRA